MVSAGADRLPRSEEEIFVRRNSSPSDGTSRRQSYSVHRHYRHLSINCNGFSTRCTTQDNKNTLLALGGELWYTSPVADVVERQTPGT